jgi:endo-1,4-beta-D-glucanase Y
MRKVNLQVIRPWVAKKVVELVGFEDEVLIEYAMGLLEDQSQPVNMIYLIFHPRSLLMSCSDTRP